MQPHHKRILFITNGFPYPPHSGFRIHDFYLHRQISQYHTVSLLSLLEFEHESEFVDHLSPFYEHIDWVVARKRGLHEHVQGVLHCLLRDRPLATHSFYYDEMAAKIRAVSTQQNIDLIQIEHSFFAPYVDAVPSNSSCKKILSLHNLGVHQYRSMLRLHIGFRKKLLFVLKWLLMRRWEARYAEKFDHILVVSPVEKQLLQTANPRLTISVIENGIDTKQYQPLAEASESNTLIFVGTMGYEPNVDAVLWFCQEMLAFIQQKIPDIKLLVVGHHPRPEIQQLAEHEDVVVTGHVPDVRPYYQQAQVCIVPLRAGGGTRLKILESMALGRPVVSTSLGCEGLNVRAGENILIADNPRVFEKRVFQLLQDTMLRQKLVHNARQLVEQQYDWTIIGRKLLNVYEQVLLGGKR